MIQNVVDRAKKNAIKSVLETGQPGLRIQHLLDSIVDEFAENEDLPNTTNPDDWARISGKKGERIVYIRTLVTGKSSSASRAIDTESNLGQYLLAAVASAAKPGAAPSARGGAAIAIAAKPARGPATDDRT